MREEYGKLDRVEMSVLECCELLNEFVDESDPDLDEPQIEHLLQTAEAQHQPLYWPPHAPVPPPCLLPRSEPRRRRRIGCSVRSR